MYVFTCAPEYAGTRVVALTSDIYPVCESGQGAWVELPHTVEIVGPDWEVVSWAFAAGLVIWTVGFSIGSIVSVVRKAR